MVSREGASTDEQQCAWLLEERAAVRRNAALVMRGAPLPELLAAVAEEVGRLVHADVAHVVRYDGDHAVVERCGATTADWGCRSASGSRWPGTTSRRW
ncbi:hypothetical protein ABT369_47165 [Dactylosporangium sp. NPDC000244]|uniref:hypothetical protein n=1 Tax=Dactylosporangium sp. NPDC000244 TaxID=3154365 RepID=UPI0033239ACA